MFALENYEENASQLGGIDVDWGAIANGVKDAAQWIYAQTKNVQTASRTATNVANNAANITAWRLDGNTVVIGGVALVALYLVLNRRR